MERGLDPLCTNLVVADQSRTEKTICLAVTPSLKAYGISGSGLLYDYIKERNMEYKILGKQNDIALIMADEVIIKDTQSALDLIASAQYETDCDKLIIDKSCVADDFFVLSTGIAGEILQKFINYRKKVAILGDYSEYTSKALRDFIYESNNGNSIYFLQTIDEAVLKLEHAQ
jgi:hypothetical protein